MNGPVQDKNPNQQTEVKQDDQISLAGVTAATGGAAIAMAALFDATRESAEAAPHVKSRQVEAFVSGAVDQEVDGLRVDQPQLAGKMEFTAPADTDIHATHRAPQGRWSVVSSLRQEPGIDEVFHDAGESHSGSAASDLVIRRTGLRIPMPGPDRDLTRFAGADPEAGTLHSTVTVLSPEGVPSVRHDADIDLN